MVIKGPLLKFRVWDWDRLSEDDFMGKFNVELDPIVNNPFIEHPMDLELIKCKKKPKSKVKGTISVSLLFKPNPIQLGHPLNEPRFGYRLCILPNGTPMIIGGMATKDGDARNTCEILNPQTLEWHYTAPMSIPRCFHTATTLGDGRILITGGYSGNPNLGYKPTSKCEIYDPNTNTWTEVSNMLSSRFRHTATLLQNGHILVVGGTQETDALNTGELYNPEDNDWYLSLNLPEGIMGHTSDLLRNGDVLIVGGTKSSIPGQTNTSFIIFESDTRTFKIGSDVPHPYVRHCTYAMPNGDIAIFPGSDWFNSCVPNVNQNTFNNVKKYDNNKKDFIRMGRVSSSSVALCTWKNKYIIAFGGQTKHSPSTKSNFFEIPNGGNVSDFGTAWKSFVEPNIGRVGHCAISVESKNVILIVGGLNDNLDPINTVEVLDMSFEDTFFK